MPVAVEGKPCAFWPAVPCCPQHCITRKLVEAIPGINKGQPLQFVVRFTTWLPLCLSDPGWVLSFLSLNVPKVIINLPGTNCINPLVSARRRTACSAPLMPASKPAHSWTLPHAPLALAPEPARLPLAMHRCQISPMATGRTPGCLSSVTSLRHMSAR
jgi:hypothetical protein